MVSSFSKPLYKDAIINIATRTLETIKTQAAKEHNVIIEFSLTFIQSMVDEGYDPRFGAKKLTTSDSRKS